MNLSCSRAVNYFGNEHMAVIISMAVQVALHYRSYSSSFFKQRSQKKQLLEQLSRQRLIVVKQQLGFS